MGREELPAAAAVKIVQYHPLAGHRFSAENGETPPVKACVTRLDCSKRLLSAMLAVGTFSRALA